MADIVSNPKARRDYHILETFEAGIVLHGTEVKSLRGGKAQISDAFAKVENDRVASQCAHRRVHPRECLRPRPQGPAQTAAEPERDTQAFGLAAVKGNALFPLSLLWKNGHVKVLLGITGKVELDEHEDIKKRETDREMKRTTMRVLEGRSSAQSWPRVRQYLLTRRPLARTLWACFRRFSFYSSRADWPTVSAARRTASASALPARERFPSNRASPTSAPPT